MRVPAWEGNWEKRIYDRVFQRDFPSLTAFADSRPTATLKDLAEELASENDVAPGQLERLLRHEAQETRHVHRFARSALVRQMHEYFSQGWMRADKPSPGPSSPDEWCRASVYATWSGCVGEEYDAPTDRVWDSLKKIARVGWLPSGPDDPIIVQAFREGRFPEDADANKDGETGGPA
jgi:hypothetical protein